MIDLFLIWKRQGTKKCAGGAGEISRDFSSTETCEWFLQLVVGETSVVFNNVSNTFRETILRFIYWANVA